MATKRRQPSRILFPRTSEKRLTSEQAEALRRFGITADDLVHEAIVKAFRGRRATRKHDRSVAAGKDREPAFISRPYLAPLGARSANASRIASAVKEVVSTKTTHKAK